MPVSAVLRKTFAICSELGLDRDDRLELAAVVLNRAVGSWSDLDDADEVRLLDAVSGFVYVHYLLRNKCP
jgi:hypothetical protein